MCRAARRAECPAALRTRGARRWRPAASSPSASPGLGGVERPEDHGVGPPVEGPVVRGEALHHVQVAAEQQQEHRPPASSRSQAVCSRTVEHGVLLGEPGQLVEDHDAGRSGSTDASTRRRRASWSGRSSVPVRGSAGREDSLSSVDESRRSPSTGEAPLVAVKKTYGHRARSQNSCTSRDFPTCRRPLIATAAPAPRL